MATGLRDPQLFDDHAALTLAVEYLFGWQDDNNSSRACSLWSLLLWHCASTKLEQEELQRPKEKFGALICLNWTYHHRGLDKDHSHSGNGTTFDTSYGRG